MGKEVFMATKKNETRQELAKDFIPLTKKLTREQKRFALVLMKNIKELHNSGDTREGKLGYQTRKRGTHGQYN